MITLTIGREKAPKDWDPAKPFPSKLSVHISLENENCHLLDKPNADQMYFGKPGSVPATVSREQCSITIGEGKEIVLRNISKSGSPMFINGTPAMSHMLKSTDEVALGKDKFRLDVYGVVKEVCKNLVYDSSGIKKIYEDYENETLRSQIRNGRFNALQRLSMVFTIGSGALVAVFSMMGKDSESMGNFRNISMILAGIFLLATAIISIVKAGSDPLKQKERKARFEESYRCPNPMCNKSLGAKSYKSLIMDGECPYCKCHLEER